MDSTISGTPLEGTKDSCFTVIASDGELSDTLEVFIKVIPINDPPQIISPNNVNAYEDSLFTYIAQAIDPENDKITFKFENYPHWMTPSDSIISGLVKKGTLDTSFTVIASDGELMDTKYDEPFVWNWNEKSIGSHIIKIIAYENNGFSVQKEREIIRFG